MKTRARLDRKWTVQISPCGRIGDRAFEITASGASAEMRSPVTRLVTMAMATIQCRRTVPTSLRGALAPSTAARRGAGRSLARRSTGADRPRRATIVEPSASTTDLPSSIGPNGTFTAAEAKGVRKSSTEAAIADVLVPVSAADSKGRVTARRNPGRAVFNKLITKPPAGQKNCLQPARQLTPLLGSATA